MGATGIVQIIEISLTPEEKAALNKSAAAVKGAVCCDRLDQFQGKRRAEKSAGKMPAQFPISPKRSCQ
jgi:hypothetical protein